MTLDLPEFLEYINKMESEARALRAESLRISWYMRGGVSYEDAMFLSYNERKEIAKIIESNMEATKKSGMPFF